MLSEGGLLLLALVGHKVPDVVAGRELLVGLFVVLLLDKVDHGLPQLLAVRLGRPVPATPTTR